MSLSKPIPVVDLFAGPGGLGEGFSSLDDGNAFKILVSAEMDAAAHKTLQLRAFYRNLKSQGEDALKSYYSFCNGATSELDTSLPAWREAEMEAKQLTLGVERDNKILYSVIEQAKLNRLTPWLLIGGPPCQAYSLVGRARNQGKVGYKAEDDQRHYLYREYLKVIQQYKPSVFVMENVKGILSSKVEGSRIFHSILRDLSNPDEALAKRFEVGYRIHSLVLPTVFDRFTDPESINVHDFIVRAEIYGIPQARHRVILIGVREDLRISPSTLDEALPTKVRDAIEDLPPLRSRLSKEVDSPEIWARIVSTHLDELHKEAVSRSELQNLATRLHATKENINSAASYGALRMKMGDCPKKKDSMLDLWYRDDRLKIWLNHETRGHMSSDLRRYLYASSFAEAQGFSPKGHEQFNLAGLRPNHENWESGKFSDRFRVQLWNRPSTTITSHISKDGHYFIHPDPSQCRSLTVREAARLQTFPDNYFFQGNRTQQFHQVGNAVPPLLASQIAAKVLSILR